MPTKTTEKAPDEKSGTDELAADVADETLEYPPGTPTLLPLLKLPRMRRAAAYKALGAIAEQQRKTDPGDASEDDEQRPETDQASESADDAEDTKVAEIDITELGDRYLVVALIEEYLAIVALNEELFRAWALEVDDADLVRVFNVYTRKAQPGEAKSSTG